MSNTNVVTHRNRNSRINSRVDRTGKIRTETVNRDWDTIKAAVSTHPRKKSTNLYVDFPIGETIRSVAFSGSEARTLYRLLQKHFDVTNKSL